MSDELSQWYFGNIFRCKRYSEIIDEHGTSINLFKEDVVVVNRIETRSTVANVVELYMHIHILNLNRHLLIVQFKFDNLYEPVSEQEKLILKLEYNI